MKKYRLDTIAQVKRQYSKLFNDLNNDLITESKCKTLAYVLNGYSKIFELNEFEKRLELLENKSNGASNE